MVLRRAVGRAARGGEGASGNGKREVAALKAWGWWKQPRRGARETNKEREGGGRRPGFKNQANFNRERGSGHKKRRSKARRFSENYV